MDENTKSLHEQSVRDYPHLNLSEGEYVIIAIRRHWIALVAPLLVGVFILALLWLLQSSYDLIAAQLNLTGVFADPNFVLLPVIALSVFVTFGMIIVYFVYEHNRFYVTNESVIQEIQYSLFSKHEQVVGLGSIEDASYMQSGILAHILGYGTIRLSTVGNEHTYTQTYVAHPRERIATLNNTVELFKNDRRIVKE